MDSRFGDGATDQVVVTIGQRVQSCVRAGDTVGRIAPDVFATVVEGIANLEDAQGIARRIIEELEAPYPVSADEAVLTPVVGISVSEQDSVPADELLRLAQVAQRYAAAHAQPDGHYALYDPKMEARRAAPPTVEIPLRDDQPPLTPAVPAAGAVEAWFGPLIERISSLEREIARMSSQRAAPRDDGA
jgi:predicted signal transduction protein with EAL and GGDEF domain